jgi:hypothetical protein
MIEGVAIGLITAAILAVCAWAWTKRAVVTGAWKRRTARRQSEKAAADNLLLEQRRQEVKARATALKERIALSKSGGDPVIVSFTYGPDFYHFRGLESYKRQLPNYPGAFRTSSWHPFKGRLLSDWTRAELDEWLASHPEPATVDG